jgi:predicted MPP superfamily phosphohydrolase
VHQAVRVPPLKDIDIVIPGLAPQFEGYALLQLTDLHISRLFPAPWARAVVKQANSLGANLIVITGDLIDGSLAARRVDIEPLRDLRSPGWRIRNSREPRVLLRLPRLDGPLRFDWNARA